MALHRSILVVAIAALLVSFAPFDGEKKKSIIDIALAKAFPGCTIERVTCRLDGAQRKQIGKLSSQRAFAKKTTFAYIARKGDEVIGTAFFDSHVVRTKRETLLIAVDPKGAVQRVETIAFREPREYIASGSFYDSLEGRGQGRSLQLGRGLDGTTGATLTCRAVADASRRALALHEVLAEKVGRSQR